MKKLLSFILLCSFFTLTFVERQPQNHKLGKVEDVKSFQEDLDSVVTLDELALEKKEKETEENIVLLNKKIQQMNENLLEDDSGSLRKIYQYVLMKENMQKLLGKIKEQRAFLEENQSLDGTDKASTIKSMRAQVERKIQMFQKIVSSSEKGKSKQFRLKAWDQLLSSCPIEWRAREVLPYNVKMLLQAPDERKVVRIVVKGPKEILMGEAAKYILRVENRGAFSAKGFVLHHKIASEMKYKGISKDSVLQWKVSELKSREHQEFSLEILGLTPGVFENKILLTKGKKVEDHVPLEIVIKDNPPKEWPESLWQLCWNGKWMDFTTPAWRKLSLKEQIKYTQIYQHWYAFILNKPVERKIETNGIYFDMVFIPPGKFLMGSSVQEKGRTGDEKSHKVLVSQYFWMGKYEVTQSQWSQVAQERPWKDKPYIREKQKYPATFISWEDVESKFLAHLDKRLDFPSEAEWEYACRAGTFSRFYWGDSLVEIGEYANSCDTTAHELGKIPDYIPEARDPYIALAQVGELKPNAFGLYDMIGNVWEWCGDWHNSYTENQVTDPRGGEKGIGKVNRGGSWYDANWEHFRSAARSRIDPRGKGEDLGVRLVYRDNTAD